MQIFGLNFTSAPSTSKPIACVRCHQRGETLYLDLLTSLSSFEMLDNFLNSDGPWIAGVDFPFGQPRPLIEALHWPCTWEGYVKTVGTMKLDEFESVLESYDADGSTSKESRLRTTDRLARIGRAVADELCASGMFFHGAPHLLDADVCVLPCRERTGERFLVEAYPALVAHKVIGQRVYKSGAGARRALLQGLETEQFQHDYGFSVSVQEAVSEELIEEPSADTLDALLCAVQAAWAWTQRDAHYGIPRGVDTLEGWIADPALKALACGS